MTYFIQYERLNEKNHRIRAKVEPASSNNRSTFLSLNYPIFSEVIKVIYLKNILYVVDLNIV
jgi:hypothetical protein